jgi:hypothetical protein
MEMPPPNEPVLLIAEYYRIRNGHPERVREHPRRPWGTVNRPWKRHRDL